MVLVGLKINNSKLHFFNTMLNISIINKNSYKTVKYFNTITERALLSFRFNITPQPNPDNIYS